MKTIRVLGFATVVIAFAVALLGCSSGSPPSQIPTNVTGTVKLLEDGSGVQGVVVVLQRGDRQYASAPSGDDGTFVIQNVLAPATYAVLVQLPDGSNLRLAGDVPDQRVEANRNGVNIGTIYVTENPPGAPGGGG